MTVSHFEGESRTAPALYALLTLNRVRLYRKRHGLAATALFWLSSIVRELLRVPADPALHGAALAAPGAGRSAAAGTACGRCRLATTRAAALDTSAVIPGSSAVPPGP